VPTLDRQLPRLAPLLADLVAASFGQIQDAALLHQNGLIGEDGLITKKGTRVLTHLRAIADVLDIPLA